MSGIGSASVGEVDHVPAAVPPRSRDTVQQIRVVVARLPDGTTDALLRDASAALRRSSDDGDLVFLSASGPHHRTLLSAAFPAEEWVVYYGRAGNDRPIAFRRSVFAKVQGEVLEQPALRPSEASRCMTHLRLTLIPVSIDVHVVSSSLVDHPDDSELELPEAANLATEAIEPLIRSGLSVIGHDQGSRQVQPTEASRSNDGTERYAVRESANAKIWFVDGDQLTWREEAIARINGPAGDRDDHGVALDEVVLRFARTIDVALSRRQYPPQGIDINTPFPPKRMLDGVDTSYHQSGRLDLREAQSAGVRFWYAKATEGAATNDPTYRKRVRQARRSGLPVGAYHFALPDAADAAQAALHFVKRANIQAGDLLPMLDLEARAELSRSELTAWAEQWVVTVRRALMARNLYGSPIICTPFDMDDDFGCLLWVARYSDDFRPPRIPEPWKRAAIWQHSNGRIGPVNSVPGFGPVDVSALHPDIPLASLLVKRIDDPAPQNPALEPASGEPSRLALDRSHESVELTFEVPEEEARYLDLLSATSGHNDVTTLARALRLLAVLERADRNGGTITVTYRDGLQERLHLH